MDKLTEHLNDSISGKRAERERQQAEIQAEADKLKKEIAELKAKLEDE